LVVQPPPLIVKLAETVHGVVRLDEFVSDHLGHDLKIQKGKKARKRAMKKKGKKKGKKQELRSC
jgi:hypothetical protein